MRDKTIKISSERYDNLSTLLKGQRQRAQVIEGLIAVLTHSIEHDKYIMHDLITDPEALIIQRKK